MEFSTTYGYTKKLAGVGYEAAKEKVTEALKTEGFGVLTEIDVKATMKKKIDVDFRPYSILGACNPKLAHQALSAELPIGLLLPCNVVVTEDDEGNAIVSIVNPKEMFKVVSNPALGDIAGGVDAKLQKVLEAL
jgi:uncharacterized protein (DUF302 family)